jgi:hypothetical protein
MARLWNRRLRFAGLRDDRIGQGCGDGLAVRAWVRAAGAVHGHTKSTKEAKLTKRLRRDLGDSCERHRLRALCRDDHAVIAALDLGHRREASAANERQQIRVDGV